MSFVKNFLFYRVDRSEPDQVEPNLATEIKSIGMILLESGKVSRYIYTTLDVPKVEYMTEVRIFGKEAELLDAFFQFWEDKNVNILQGFNNHTYDNKLIVARRILNGQADNGMSIRNGKLVDAEGHEANVLQLASKTTRSVDMVDIVRNTFQFKGEELLFSRVSHALLGEPVYGFSGTPKPEDYVYGNYENAEKIVNMLTKTDEWVQRTGKPFSALPPEHTVMGIYKA